MHRARTSTQMPARIQLGSLTGTSDGVEVNPGVGTVQVTIGGDANSVVYQYRQAAINPNPGRGIQPAGGSSAQGTN